eukprot:12253390-Alexandrium_andersonii.AAC.1
MRFSLARPGSHGGRQGGVAVLVPTPYRVVSAQEHIPGCCIDVTVRRGGNARDDEGPGAADWTVRNVYVPPQDKRRVALS